MEARKCGNYEASMWDDDYIQSLTTVYGAKEFVEQAEKLKNVVKSMIEGASNDLAQLELIDDLQRLDVSYHFGDTVGEILERVFDDKEMKDDLHFTALKLRLLRQHGYHVPQEVLSSFMDDTGNFQTGLADDVKGLLSLYEASFLSMEGEAMLDSAKDFSTRHLAKKLQQFTIDDRSLEEQIRHALELPLHWRMHKLEAKWFIHVYESRPDANHILLEFAKLDFNMVQAKYQDDLKRISRRYNKSGLAEKLSFARDRLAECFLWALGFTREPHFGYTREIMTKVAVMITVIDDVYDIYGTPEEIELFTKTIERWDITELDNLPAYMQICFLDLNNFVNELASLFLKEQGLNIIPNLRKLWTEQCKAYYIEAKWFHSGYFPSTNEYLNHGWKSIGGVAILFYGYFCVTNPIKQKELQSLEEYPCIIYSPSMVFRLADDLGTSSWTEQCKAYYIEAKWFHSGYFPSTNEYLNHGWKSIGGVAILFYGYFCVTNPIKQKELQSLEEYPCIIYSPSMVFRLADDLGTSSDEIKRGDNPKSIQCYMHETGCSEEVARKHIMKLIEKQWKKMNKDIISKSEEPISTYGPIAMNLARMSLCFYLNGDGFGNNSHSETKEKLVSLIVEPFPLP